MHTRPDVHALTGHGLLRLLVAAILAVALVATLEVTPVAAATSGSCSVTSKDSGRTDTGLRAAVEAAKPGSHLVVRGTCAGGTVIDKDLVIEGVTTGRRGEPILDGKDKVRVLRVVPGVRVTLRDLIIQDGRATHSGGGIVNRGIMKLRDVVVRRNRAGSGGGVFNAGTLRLRGTSRIKNNRADHGGGVLNAGALTLRDSSSIRDNQGGGAYNAGSLSLRDRSAISGNRHLGPGPGVYNVGGSLTMSGTSAIHGNHSTPPPSGSGYIMWLEAPPAGGLVSEAGSLIGVRCAPEAGANVHSNTPRDCEVE